MPLPMQIFGKRPRQELMATGLPGPASSGHRLFVRDRVSNLRFLVDTGADISVVPPTRLDRACDSSCFPSQTAVNGSSIATYGQRCLTVDIGVRRSFTWVFRVAVVSNPILGADFLRHFNIQVDLRNQRLRDHSTNLSASAFTAPAAAIDVVITTEAVTDPYGLLPEFPTLTKPPDYHQPILHDVVHRIETQGQPVHSKARRLAPDRLTVASNECLA